MVCNRNRRGGKPLISLSVEPLEDSTDLWGKTAADLQDDIIIEGNAIAGTLKYVADYSSAFPAGLDSGNYLALKFESDEDTEIEVEIINGTSGPVVLDDDGIWVGRIADKSTQTIKVVASKDEQSVTKTFTLNELDCETE